MIWHIFKKDWRLMGPYAAGLAGLHFSLMAALLRIGRFRAAPISSWIGPGGIAPLEADHTLYTLTNVFPILSYLATALLIAVIVQQDAIPGVRQDWLVRPIRRRDLFLAKLVAVLVMALAPIFAADLLGALLNGFPPGQSMDAALGRSIWLWFSLFLVVFALASLTKNLMEAVVGATALTGAYFVLQAWRSYNPTAQMFFVHGQVDWIDRLIRLGIVCIGAAVLLSLQYALRKTFVSRLLMVGFFLLLLLVPSVPWQTAFALEERLSKNPADGNAVTISFVRDRATPEDRPVGPLPYDRSDASVMLPVRAMGVPDGAILYGESSTARIITQDGQTQMNEGQARLQMGIPTRGGERPDSGKPFTYVLRVPRGLYSRIADQPVRLEIDYYLTLLKVADTQTLPALGGDQRSRDLGWCGTKVSDAGGELLVGCVSAAAPPGCASMVLEYKPTGAQNPPNGICVRPDYSPFPRGFGPDALNRFTERLPFGNPTGVDQYPVKEPMLPESQVKVTMYQAEDHFERELTIPQIRLREWVAAE
ncbi:MAG TPA: hypothetical protein VK724_18480 [Bryobacteraceae bacterium]|nr:hypothetical protein [Bryobacteraceae bacterium]